jgi:hypothetical protein
MTHRAAGAFLESSGLRHKSAGIAARYDDFGYSRKQAGTTFAITSFVAKGVGGHKF